MIELNRALSLTPPWPLAILHLGKRIENRQRWPSCPYRGPIWLHSAKGFGTKDDFEETVRQLETIGNRTNQVDRVRSFFRDGLLARKDGRIVPGAKMARGAIVGRAWVTGVAGEIDNHQNAYVDVVGPPAMRRPMTSEERIWWQGGFALLLDKVQVLLDPVPCVGALSIFRIPDDVLARCLEQLPANA
jgi:hypothetical protein